MGFKPNQPRIDLPKDSTNIMIRWATLVLVLETFLVPAISYSDLPSRIPIHFNFSGEADGYGPKYMIWFTSILAAVMAFILNIFSSRPHLFNYPNKITEENAPRKYAIGIRLMVILNFTTVGIFVIVQWKSIQVALGHAGGLGTWFLVATIAILGLTMLYFAMKMTKQK